MFLIRTMCAGAVVVLVGCQDGRVTTTTGTDAGASSGTTAGASTESDTSAGESTGSGGSTSGGEPTTGAAIDRCACPADLTPSCALLQIGCEPGASGDDLCEYACGAPTVDNDVMTCWLERFAAGSAGVLEWEASTSGGYGGRRGVFVLNGDGTVISTEHRWCDFGGADLGSFLLALAPPSHFEGCLALADGAERLQCLSEGIGAAHLETCVEVNQDGDWNRPPCRVE